jgi:hypothetical protein
LPSIIKRKIIVDFDDILSESIYDIQFQYRGYFSKVFLKINRELLKIYEKKCLSFGASIFCSNLDKKKFDEKKVISKLYVVPNIYYNKYFNNFDFGNGFLNGDVFLFVGALDYKPNIDGLLWFVKDVFNQSKKFIPKAKLIVVGKNPKRKIYRLCAERDDIEIYANARDLRKYYARSRAIIVPLLVGGGTRVKILEAALTKRPILSTPVGASGLELKNGSEIHLFSNASELIKHYKKLGSQEYYSRTVNRALKIVNTKYGESTMNFALKTILKNIDN